MSIYNKFRYLGTTLTLITAISGAGLVALPAVADDRVRLNFGVYSSNKPTAMVRQFKPILNALENSMADKLGRDVDIRMQIAKDYDQGVADLTNGKVDFSRFGPASYVEAKRENDDLEILAIESIENAKVFYGIIAVKSDSDITNIKQVKNRSFAFGDESSTIGRYLSQLYLENNAIRASDLSSYEYLGRHDRVGTAVGAGDFDAGALNEATFKKLLAQGEPIREIARFPNVTKPWIARKGLEPEVFIALRESLLDLKDARVLKSLKVNGFLEGGDEDYQTIRTAMEFNDKFFKEPQTAAALPDSGTSETLAPVVAATNGSNSIQINIEFESDDMLALRADGDETGPIVVNLKISGSMNAPNVEITRIGNN